MLSNRLAFVALAAACIGAAAGGGYLASRQNSVPAVTQAASATPAPNSSTGAAVATPVQETEAVVGDSSKAPVAGAAVLTPTTPAKHVEPAARPASQPTASKVTQAPSNRSKASEPLPTLDRTWPSGAGNQPASAPIASAPTQTPSPADPNAAAARPEERAAAEPARTPEPPQKTLEELVVAADSVMGLESGTTVTSDRARVEDRIDARVTRDVRVRDAVAIPAGSRVLGTVVSVEPGGKFRQRARLGIRFNTLVLADGTRTAISTETIYRDGEAPSKDASAKMTGGAVGGAILGAILGGGKGAAIGGAVGAGAGAGAVMAGERSQAALHQGEQFTVRILSPVTVTVEQK